jgi:TetR/AcrR family transcriptional regulator, tetracycline repressor protein
MPRPRVPLISRRKVAEETLKLIDEVGVEGFNIRLLAKELGVNGASFYHHYEGGKSEIFDDAARLLVSEVEQPVQFDDDFVEAAVRSSIQYREVLLRHPNAVPLMLEKLPLAGRYAQVGVLRANIERLGASPRQAMLAGEILESVVLGSVLTRTARTAEERKELDLHEDEEREFFEKSIRALLLSFGDNKRKGKRRPAKPAAAAASAGPLQQPPA